jgi:hypothetical protein
VRGQRPFTKPTKLYSCEAIVSDTESDGSVFELHVAEVFNNQNKGLDYFRAFFSTNSPCLSILFHALIWMVFAPARVKTLWPVCQGFLTPAESRERACLYTLGFSCCRARSRERTDCGHAKPEPCSALREPASPINRATFIYPTPWNNHV